MSRLRWWMKRNLSAMILSLLCRGWLNLYAQQGT
jgi:hypothetical protein